MAQEPAASDNPTAYPSKETLDIMQLWRRSPVTLSTPNTQTTFVANTLFDWKTPPAPPLATTRTPSATTGMTDMHALAESLMFDATRLVAMFDSAAEPDSAAPRSESATDLVHVKSVLRAGAAVTGAFAVVCGLGTWLSGIILLHPLLALLLLLASAGFYLMSFFPKGLT